MQSLEKQKKRAFWLKQFYLWHWVSSATCLVGMLLFAVTGLTLNNATHLKTEPQITTVNLTLPEPLLVLLAVDPPAESSPLPAPVAHWAAGVLATEVSGIAAEWSADEVYLSLPRPGGDAWMTIGRGDGKLFYERTDLGWVSYLNDLHKGRNTGLAWSWFLDVFSVAALMFSLTGLCLLTMHATKRPSTWPLVGFGVVLPVVLIILFIH